MKEIFANSIKLIVDKFVLGIPNFIMALIIAAVGFMIAKALSKGVIQLLKSLKVDRFGEMFNQIDVVRQNNVEVKISSIAGSFLYYMLILIFMVAATDVLQMQSLSNLVSNTIEFIPNLVVALAILIMGLIFADKLKSVVRATCESLGIASAKLIANFVFYFIFVTVFIMALSQASIDTAFLSRNISIILAGAVLAFSIGYGLASKDVVANYLAAFTSKGRYEIGDVVTIGSHKGKIVDLDKHTITLAYDDIKVVMPYSRIVNEDVILH